jgi:hypothetical protein
MSPRRVRSSSPADSVLRILVLHGLHRAPSRWRQQYHYVYDPRRPCRGDTGHLNPDPTTPRVRKRGRIGPKTGALLRSGYALLLGLGGWFLGAVIVLTTMPGVRIDNELLVVLSVGSAIYLAWVHREWSAQTRRVGGAAAVSSALIGAWLGFNATGGFLGVVTAIVGAILGANLALILLDISWDRIGHPPSGLATDPDSTPRSGIPLEGVGQ